ncbi:death-associated protein kinase related-like [Portunus trituberculatus]|uniref:death-associated protein kinase related-like n=1 Tax=Portunus trituberculatus TaxID=210409 RepID=UPI001E1CB10D|nr:death-associated protein kinase related-like [Portunus trituberculatus]
MKSVGAGVVLLDTHGGYLDLTPGALEQLISKEPINHHYEVEQTPFARGKFAAVRRARCLRSGTWYAAKVMRKRRRAQDVRHEILHEAAILLLARPSSRIVSLHQLYETTSEIILVLELAEGGELQRVIDEEESLGEEAVRRYMTNILAALRFLHAHNIAHLDLKPQNLLLMGQHPGSEVKLCDFGISRIILSDIEVREVLGTPDYVAPEILQYEPISLATDMWSVGVLAYVLLTGHSPFGGNTKQETFLNISQGHVDFPEELFEGVSEPAMDFITRLLIVEPGCRMNVQEAMEHVWLSSLQPPARPAPPPTHTVPSSPCTPVKTPPYSSAC